MSTTKQVPVLGIDSAAWLTAWVDYDGRRSYFVGTGTSNQRLNLPSSALAIKPLTYRNETIQFEFDSELVSGLNNVSSRKRKTEYLFACSRCAIPVRVLSGQWLIDDNLPLLFQSDALVQPHVDRVRIRLDVETVYDLAKNYCRLGTEEYSNFKNMFPIEIGSIIPFCHGLETNILRIDTEVGPREFAATLYSQSASIVYLGHTLEMPTFEGSQRVGEILR